jgi:polar amino acid transport system substrate-binding protein
MITDFCEIFQVEQIHYLLESCYEITGIRSAILDADAHVILDAGWLKTCKIFKCTENSVCASCQECRDLVKKQYINFEGKGHAYKCRNGYWNLAMPIVVAGQFMGIFLAGQFFPGSSPSHHGKDRNENSELNGLVPISSYDQLRKMVIFFNNMFKEQASLRLKTNGSRGGIREQKTAGPLLYRCRNTELTRQLAGGLAHDFNNILQSIIGYSELLVMKLDKDERIRGYAEKVLCSAHRGAKLTDRLIAFSGKPVSNEVPLDIGRFVSELEKRLRNQMMEGICFMINAPEKGLFALADRWQIEQILLNLVTNAVDAMPKGGFFTIEVLPAVIDENFIGKHGFGEAGEYVSISVKDTGRGMDDETRMKLFEPFFSTKEVGMGLGLAIVGGIVMQLDGFMTVDSAPGRGSTIRIYLPRINLEYCATSEKTTQEKSPFIGSETILLADDDKSIRELNCMILQEAGYKVIKAVDGQDALEKFKEKQETIDLLALDVMMPKMDGKRAYEEIRKLRPDIRTIFVSGYTKDLFLDRELGGEYVSFLSKPVHPFDFLKKVREALDDRSAGDSCNGCG